MNSIQQDIDERSTLAGTNKFELLLFRLGGGGEEREGEIFGINVFKIREIVAMPAITPIAGAAPHMMGVVNLRGEIIPVLDLPAIIGCTPERGLNIMLVTEFARTTQAFAVESVDEIVRLDWSHVLSAESTSGSALVTSIARLDGNVDHSRLVQVLDVEAILRLSSKERNSESDLGDLGGPIILPKGQIIIAADDSAVARALIEQGLQAMGLPYIMFKSGKEAWDRILLLEGEAQREGRLISEKIALVLTDIEMPEMDGFTLTRNIKGNVRLKSLPVVIHSSLSGQANESKVKEVGADAYVAKFVAAELVGVIRAVLTK